MLCYPCLQDWSNGNAIPPVVPSDSDKPKKGEKPAVPDTALVVATKPATKSLLDDAYPDMLSIAATALDFWTKGKTEVPSFSAMLLQSHKCTSAYVLHAQPCYFAAFDLLDIVKVTLHSSCSMNHCSTYIGLSPVMCMSPVKWHQPPL